MSYRDNNGLNCIHENYYDIHNIDGEPIFNFSLLKSKKMVLSDYFNKFNCNFSKENSNLKKSSKKINNNKIIPLKENDISDINSSFLRTHNRRVSTSENSLNQQKIDLFLNEYNNSFAYFCGINKEQFKDLFINNQYKPVLNELGNIILPKKVIDCLKAYSFTSKINKKSMIKKKRRFKITHKGKKLGRNNTFTENKKKHKQINKSNKNENIDNNLNNSCNNNKNDSNKENYNSKPSLINIKNKLIKEKVDINISNNIKIKKDITPITHSPFTKEFLENFQINDNINNNNDNILINTTKNCKILDDYAIFLDNLPNLKNNDESNKKEINNIKEDINNKNNIKEENNNILIGNNSENKEKKENT